MTESNDAARPRLVLVDGYGLIFRAYHALPPSMATKTGEQTNAVFGVASMLLDVIKHQQPEMIAVALDVGHSFRREEYEGYKGTRAEMPEDLRGQIDRVKQLFDVLNIPTFSMDGYEADDIIGSLSLHCSKEGYEVIIVTGDSDLLQLVGDNIEAVLPGARRFGEFREFDTPAVFARYGFAPELIPDYKALVGDTSDNIPGVPGIGEKTATALIEKYGPIEQIFAHLDEITPARAQKALAGNEDKAAFSKHLATIVRDLEIPFDAEQARVKTYDREAAVELFQELEFRTLVNKLPESNGHVSPKRAAALAAAPPVERPASVRELVNSCERLEQLAKRIREAGAYAIDVETTAVDPMSADLVGIAIAVSPHEGYYIPVAHPGWSHFSIEDVRTAIGPVIADRSLTAYTHHGKYDLQVLERHGFEIGNIEFDTMVAAFLLNEHSIGLKDLAFNRLGIHMTEIESLIGSGRDQLTMNMVSAEEAADYASGDVEATYGLVEVLRPEIEAKNQSTLLHEIELPLIPVLVRMERTGVALDLDYLRELDDEISKDLGQIEGRIYQLAERKINIGSTKQIATLLFEELKLPAGRKTKTGYSVDADVLENIRDQHEIVGLILEYRTLQKLKSTYVDALPLQVNPRTGRVHTNYNMTVAATGRLSSNNPNLQNIPIRTEIGRRVRQAFVADHRPDKRLFNDSVLLSADYSQIELRLMAHLSGEPFLVEAFRAGQDIHRATAALVYGVEVADVTPDMRRVAKTVNFGLLYGMQAFGLSRDTGLSRQDAQRFINEYWSRLPKVRQYFDGVLSFGAQNGYVETMSGRRRYAPDLTSSNQQRRAAAERMAMNLPLQGSAADIMKVAMLRMDERITKENLPARMILQVHDELVFEVERADAESFAKHVLDVMENAWPLTVPLEADVAIGRSWNELEELPR